MSLDLYMDVHVKRAVTDGLRRLGVNVLTAQEDGAAHLNDAELLDRATVLRRVLFSQDDDLLRESRTRQLHASEFGGLIYAHQLNITVGQTIRDLELIAKFYDPADMENRVEYLPL